MSGGEKDPTGEGPGGRPAGPVAAGDPPPPAVAKASSGAVPPAAPPAGAEEQVELDFEALLADTQRERDEYLDLAKRTKADFENYRKRMSAEVQAATARGKAELARELIGAIDNLERALAVAGIDPDREDSRNGDDTGEGAEGPDGLAHGVLLVFRGLRETLTRNGIEAVDPKGERFDPQWHEALSTRPADGAEPGTVLEVLQKGYRLNDQLVRPARVVVSE